MAESWSYFWKMIFLGTVCGRGGAAFRFVMGAWRGNSSQRAGTLTSEGKSGYDGDHQEAENARNAPHNRLPDAADHQQPVFEFIHKLDQQLH